MKVKRFLYRLVRRIKRVFDFRDMWSWEHEHCGNCGSCYRWDYKVKDEVWNLILPENVEWCPNCFIQAAGRRQIRVTMADFDWFYTFPCGPKCPSSHRGAILGPPH